MHLTPENVGWGFDLKVTADIYPFLARCERCKGLFKDGQYFCRDIERMYCRRCAIKDGNACGSRKEEHTHYNIVKISII